MKVEVEQSESPTVVTGTLMISDKGSVVLVTSYKELDDYDFEAVMIHSSDNSYIVGEYGEFNKAYYRPFIGRIILTQ